MVLSAALKGKSDLFVRSSNFRSLGICVDKILHGQELTEYEVGVVAWGAELLAGIDWRISGNKNAFGGVEATVISPDIFAELSKNGVLDYVPFLGGVYEFLNSRGEKTALSRGEIVSAQKVFLGLSGYYFSCLDNGNI